MHILAGPGRHGAQIATAAHYPPLESTGKDRADA